MAAPIYSFEISPGPDSVEAARALAPHARFFTVIFTKEGGWFQGARDTALRVKEATGVPTALHLATQRHTRERLNAFVDELKSLKTLADDDGKHRLVIISGDPLKPGETAPDESLRYRNEIGRAHV